MKNIELQKMLKEFNDDLDVIINHPDGDWRMEPTYIAKWAFGEDHLLICTDFNEGE